MNATAQILAGMMALAALGQAAANPAEVVSHVPMSQGLTLVSALHSREGDRENVVSIEALNDIGVTYAWHAVQHTPSGQRAEASFSRFVRSADLASAQRLNNVFWSEDATQYPGYTAFSISSAVYDRVSTSGEAPFAVTALDSRGPFGALSGASGPEGGALAGLLRSHVVYKGTLSTVAREPEDFPVLLNSRRVNVPALHLRGQFAYQQSQLRQDVWVLADRSHPLILKVVTGNDTYQMVRIDMPATREAASSLTVMERSLDSECRAELPGIYFAFGTADLDRASEQTLAAIGKMLERHADWTLSVEGHTDSIGTAAANEKLSLGRAEAVRSSLVQQHGVGTRRLAAKGYGAERPRESNSTIEGRARNRRVELVRPCASAQSGAKS